MARHERLGRASLPIPSPFRMTRLPSVHGDWCRACGRSREHPPATSEPGGRSGAVRAARAVRDRRGGGGPAGARRAARRPAAGVLGAGSRDARAHPQPVSGAHAAAAAGRRAAGRRARAGRGPRRARWSLTPSGRSRSRTGSSGSASVPPTTARRCSSTCRGGRHYCSRTCSTRMNVRRHRAVRVNLIQRRLHGPLPRRRFAGRWRTRCGSARCCSSSTGRGARRWPALRCPPHAAHARHRAADRRLAGLALAPAGRDRAQPGRAGGRAGGADRAVGHARRWWWPAPAPRA